MVYPYFAWVFDIALILSLFVCIYRTSKSEDESDTKNDEDIEQPIFVRHDTSPNIFQEHLDQNIRSDIAKVYNNVVYESHWEGDNRYAMCAVSGEDYERSTSWEVLSIPTFFEEMSLWWYRSKDDKMYSICIDHDKYHLNRDGYEYIRLNSIKVEDDYIFKCLVPRLDSYDAENAYDSPCAINFSHDAVVTLICGDEVLVKNISGTLMNSLFDNGYPIFSNMTIKLESEPIGYVNGEVFYGKTITKEILYSEKKAKEYLTRYPTMMY